MGVLRGLIFKLEWFKVFIERIDGRLRIFLDVEWYFLGIYMSYNIAFYLFFYSLGYK